MDKIVIFIPIITGYIFGTLCGPRRNAGEKISARPPGYVFGIIWTIIYLLIGYSWYLIRSKVIHHKLLTDILFGINTILSIKWLILFGCFNLKKLALYTLIALIASTLIIIIFSIKYSNLAACLLSPYLAWLLFAQQLNYSIVNK